LSFELTFEIARQDGLHVGGINRSKRWCPEKDLF
jgi:hypothetical protein